jgi:hypothetical protein
VFPVLLPEVTPTVTGAVRTYTRKPRYRQDQQFSRPFRLNKHSMQADGLVGWWPTLGQSGEVVHDFSPNNNNAIFGSGAEPTWTTTAEHGSVLEYFGAEHVDAGINTYDLGIRQNVTLGGWYKTNALDQDRVCGDVSLTSGVNGMSLTQLNTGNARFYWAGSSNLTLEKSVGASAGVWNHLIGINDGTNLLLFFNGYHDPSWSLACGIDIGDSDNTFLIGKRGDANNPMEGLIADIRIYNRALTPSEVWQLYAPQTRWELYEPIPRTFPVLLPEAAAAVTTGAVRTYKRTPRYRQDQQFSRPFRLNKNSMQAQGLVGWWPTLGQAGVDRVTNYAYEKDLNTFVGGLGWSTSILGLVLGPFDVSDDYVEGGLLDNPPSNNLSYSCWAYTTTRGVVYHVGHRGGYTLEAYDDTGDNWAIRLDNIGWLDGDISCDLNTWQFVSGIRDSGTWRLFVNGIESTLTGRFTTTTTDPQSPDPNIRIGNQGFDPYFAGFASDFRLYSRALSPSEVYQLYAPQTRWELYEPIPRTFPVLLPEVTPTVTGAVRTYTRKPRYRQDQQFSRPFRLNKNSMQAEGLLAWFATNRNTGSPHVLFDMVNNFVVSQATAAQQPTFTRDSNFGSTISFDGSDKLTSTSNFVTGIGSGNFTWACWVYPISAPGTWDGIMGIHTDSRPGLYVRTASTNWGTWFTSLQIDSGNVLSAGQWYHLAFLRRGTTIYFYENGLQTPSTGTTSNSITDTALTLGASSTGTEYGNIRLADVRVYNRALSPSEVYQLYAPQTRWELYEPIPRIFPVVVGDVAPPAQVIGPFPTHFRI